MMKKYFLLFLFIFSFTKTEASFTVKNWEQFGLGAACTTMGLIGAGLTIKLLKELFSKSNECSKLEQEMSNAGALLRKWCTFYGNVTEYHTELKLTNKEFSAAELASINNNWNKWKSIQSDQHFTQWMLSSTIALSILLFLGPSMMYGQVKHS